jgi:hypothetical protein
METSLHRELKQRYADEAARFEVRLDRYRIDVVTDSELVEIQHGSLAAIRGKIRQLLRPNDQRVRVVKPIVVAKQLVKRRRKDGPVHDRRRSPKRNDLWGLFDELVYFTRVFPHPRLTLDVPLVEIEEWRYPGHGRRRRWRDGDYIVEDQKLLEVHGTHHFRTTDDLIDLLPPDLSSPFHTGHLAEALDKPRWLAQQIAYCLRETGAAQQVGKQGNARLYVLQPQAGVATAIDRTRRAG